MEQLMIDNADRFRKLVSEYKPKPRNAKESTTTSATENIIVSTRIRPLLEDELSAGFPAGVLVRDGENGVVDVHELRQRVRGPPTITSSDYAVDHVFGEDSTTDELYEVLVKPLVSWAWSGGVATVFAYGQTGSGKSFTVSGLERLVAADLTGGQLEGEKKIHACIVELAGNNAYDLLNSRKQISVLEDSFGTTQLAGVVEHVVSDTETLLGYIEAAASFRKTESTFKNDTSSRSHAICRLRIENTAIPSAEDGTLYLIDLAGSEAARDIASHDANRMKETREINKSLSVLKDCIRGRATLDSLSIAGKPPKKPYIPFRHSALTKTLKHVFDPAGTRGCRTIVIACVNPCLADIGASKNTLRYAELLRVVVPKAGTLKYDPAVPSTWNNEQLKQWIEKSSGTPAVSGAILAPTESGQQLLRLPVTEFLSRCLRTPGLILEQAQAFQSKFWQLHIDSQRNATTAVSKPTEGVAESDDHPLFFNSSFDTTPGAQSIPFKERIRPGMVVSWTPPMGALRLTGLNLLLVLSPASAIKPGVQDLLYREINPASKEGEEKQERWLCAIVAPAIMFSAYDMNLWRQVAINVDQMETEVILEYDMGTRSYYIKV